MMKPFALVLAASIISLSAGYEDELGSQLPVASLLYLDKMLYDFHVAEDEKCEVNPRKKKSEMNREPYPGYIPWPCSYPCRDPVYSEETPEHPSDSGKSDELGALISEILEKDSTPQPSEGYGDSAENAAGYPPNIEINSVEEREGASSKESAQEIQSHEYQNMIRSVNE